MATIANTAFELYTTTHAADTEVVVPGYFGSYSGDTFTGDVCPSGFLVVPQAKAPLTGYEHAAPPVTLTNGNCWNFVAAANGTSATSNNTGIFAQDYQGVPQATIQGNLYNIGAKTLGLELPKDERGDFREIQVGKQYKFASGNFTAAPTAANKYCAIANGRLTPASSKPASGLYFEYFGDGERRFNQPGSTLTGYVVMAKLV